MRLRHVLGPLSAAATVAVLIAACLVTEESPYTFDGGALGSCIGNVAREIPLDQCPVCAVDAGGTGVAYTQCLGSTYNGCTCQVTCGYTVLNADGTVSDEAGARGQATSNVEPHGTCCGQVAEEMPGSACFGCTGSTAYALCQNESLQCACACTLPTGYTLVGGEDGAATTMCDAGDAGDAGEAGDAGHASDANAGGDAKDAGKG